MRWVRLTIGRQMLPRKTGGVGPGIHSAKTSGAEPGPFPDQDPQTRSPRKQKQVTLTPAQQRFARITEQSSVGQETAQRKAFLLQLSAPPPPS
eukprot:13494048-Alexandrium_andersonii.AAC.1